MLNDIINAFLQLLVFTLIPLLVYLFKKEKKQSFFAFIGLYRSPLRANLLALGVAFLVGGPLLLFSFFDPEFRAILSSPTSMMGKFKVMGFGFASMLLIVVDAGIKTSLSEEIFFRGFLAKRLIAVTNFRLGNFLQAVAFGSIHTLLFMTITDNYLFLTVIFIFPSIGAYLKVYLNERMAGGSILPGWIAHGVGNLLAYTLGAFLF